MTNQSTERSPDRGKGKRWSLAALFLLMTLPASAQMEPCGFYERDGVPGYGEADLRYTIQYWLGTASHSDFNSDGRVNVRDFVIQASCVNHLAHGLLGKYYGFEDGTPGQDISFPDFDAIPGNPDPVVVKVTDRFEVFDGFRGFMNSDMRHQFGARYDGYLFVPEDATYTLGITGRRGMRVRLDGAQILAFDGSPENAQTTMPLTYGLHPLRIELYTDATNARASFFWSSNGILGSSSQIVEPIYLYHESETVPEHAGTALTVLFDPPSGSGIPSQQPAVTAYVMGPNSDVTLTIDGQEKILKDGLYQSNLSLPATGLNQLNVTVTDGDGRTSEETYRLYFPVSHPDNGLAANLYATEWYDFPLPSSAGLLPFAGESVPGTQLTRENEGYTLINGKHIGRGVIVELVGAISMPSDKLYEFNVSGNAGLFINGEFIAGIGHNYANQYQPDGQVYLTEGRHHYRLRVSEPWQGPAVTVLWRGATGNMVPIPDTQFRHGAGHFDPAPVPGDGTGGRYDFGLVAEYLFQPGAVFADTAGNGYDLNPDPQAIPRSTGGITYRNGGSLSSEQAGVHLAADALVHDRLSLEVDFVLDEVFFDFTTKNLVSLTSDNYSTLAALYVRNDDLYFVFYDQNGGSMTISADNTMVPGNRYHVIGTWMGDKLRLYLNGNLAVQQNYNPNITGWPNLCKFNVGQPWMRRYGPDVYDQQLRGTFLAAACYSREVIDNRVTQNMNANMTLVPTPAPYVPATVTFPPLGSTQADLDEAFHVLNRLSFGPSPETLNQVISGGVTSWIDQQLNPAAIDDSLVDAVLASRRYHWQHYFTDFQAQTLFRMAASRRQLLEVMTQFWENHFNTQMNKVQDLPREHEENESFRANALGSFGDLLRASAMHYPMTVYLDSDSNVVGAPNENYAREIMELHTKGVNNGYTQADIEEAARCFTGWTVRDGAFYFDAGLHDYGEKTLLGMTVPAGGGISDGLMVIDNLVSSTEAADFVTWKLCQLLIADDPPADVWAAASATFAGTNGDITQVLQTITNHPRFRTDLAYRDNKVKTPMEFLASLLRATESKPAVNSFIDYLNLMGMEMFNFADPTGFPEEAVAWIDTNSLLVRWNMVNDFTSNRGNGRTIGFDIKTLAQKYQWTTSDSILDFFENITSHGTQPAGVRPITEAWLTDGNPGGFTLTDSVLANQARQTLGLYFRLSEFNKQ